MNRTASESQLKTPYKGLQLSSRFFITDGEDNASTTHDKGKQKAETARNRSYRIKSDIKVSGTFKPHVKLSGIVSNTARTIFQSSQPAAKTRKFIDPNDQYMLRYASQASANHLECGELMSRLQTQPTIARTQFDWMPTQTSETVAQIEDQLYTQLELDESPSHESLAQSPVTPSPIPLQKSFLQFEDAMSHRKTSLREKRLVPVSASQIAQYYQKFKHLDRVLERDAMFNLRNDLQVSMLHVAKQTQLMPRSFNYFSSRAEDKPLLKLDIQNQHLGPRYSRMVSTLLGHQELKHLTHIKAKKNDIGQNSLSEIIQVLPPTIQKIDLSCNKLEKSCSTTINQLLNSR